MVEKAVAVDKVRQAVSGSSPSKSKDRVGRKVNRTRQGTESPDRKETSRSSSPRKKDSLESRRRKERRSRSGSKSPVKSVSSLDTARRSSGSSARIVELEVQQTTKLRAGNNQDEEEEFDDETGGSSVSIDV